MVTRWSVIASAVLAVLLLSALGCGSSMCPAGFDAVRWHDDRVAEADSIAKCGLLEGWSEPRARNALGKPYGGSPRDGLRWNLGDDADGIGPSLRILTLTFDGARVSGATVTNEPY